MNATSPQEVVDMQCEVERRGRIFFPDFCNLCLRFPIQLDCIDCLSDIMFAEVFVLLTIESAS